MLAAEAWLGADYHLSAQHLAGGAALGVGGTLRWARGSLDLGAMGFGGISPSGQLRLGTHWYLPSRGSWSPRLGVQATATVGAVRFLEPSAPRASPVALSIRASVGLWTLRAGSADVDLLRLSLGIPVFAPFAGPAMGVDLVTVRLPPTRRRSSEGRDEVGLRQAVEDAFRVVPQGRREVGVSAGS